MSVEAASAETSGRSANDGLIASIRPLGQLRSPEERRHVFGPTLWQRLTRRLPIDQPAADEPVRRIVVSQAQLERLPRSLAGGEMVVIVFDQRGGVISLNPGYDHPHVERCVAKPGSCRSAALWTDNGASSPRPTGRLYLRMWRHPALPEFSTGMAPPPLTIADGLAIVGAPGGHLPLILPDVMTLSESGQSAILDRGRQLGLLDGEHDFGAGPDGGTSHILLSFGQEKIELRGPDPIETAADLTSERDAPAAFARFWQLLGSLDDWLGSELGPPNPYHPERLVVLAIAPIGGRPYRPTDIKWPLARTFVDIEGSRRGCFTIAGHELEALLPLLEQADPMTQFVDSRRDLRLLMVRALVPGEPSPCA